MKSFGLFMYMFITITNAGQQFVASPNILQIDLLEKLDIECTATPDSTLTLTTQIRILFSNSTDQPVYNLLGLVDSVFGLYNTSGAVESGEIVGNGTSKLRLTWNYPNQDRAGVYKCEVRAKNIDGVQKLNSHTVTVTALVPDQLTILNSFKKLSSDMNDMKAASAKQELVVYNLTKRLDHGKSKFFRVSNVFQGRRYHLSANSNILVTADAEAMCEIFGGYLVEVDSAEEHQFIVTFLGNFTQYMVVLTGGSDEITENNWINVYSETPVKYINWAPFEPNGGRGGNCIFFYKDDGWKMIDHTCYEGLVTDFAASYLCEILE